MAYHSLVSVVMWACLLTYWGWRFVAWRQRRQRTEHLRDRLGLPAEAPRSWWERLLRDSDGQRPTFRATSGEVPAQKIARSPSAMGRGDGGAPDVRNESLTEIQRRLLDETVRRARGDQPPPLGEYRPLLSKDAAFMEEIRRNWEASRDDMHRHLYGEPPR